MTQVAFLALRLVAVGFLLAAVLVQSTPT